MLEPDARVPPDGVFVTEIASPRSARESSTIVELLAPVAVFSGLEPKVLAEIGEVASLISIAPDEPLVRQGEPGDALYIIITGVFDVVLEHEGGEAQTLARLGPGEWLGELALLTHRPRAATVIARTPSRALRIGAESFEEITKRHPEAHRQIVEYAARRLPSIRLAATGLFVGVDQSALSRFDNESNWVRVRGDQVLFKQGDVASEMYVIVYGSLEVMVENRLGHSRLVDVLGPGDSVGEMALLTDEPRSATVRAIRDTELVRIPKQEFLRLLEENPRTAVELSRTLVRRLRQTTSAPRLKRFARTVALVSAHREEIASAFAPRLSEALVALGDSVLRLSSATVDAELGADIAQTRFEDLANGRLINWLNEREERYRYVVYECDRTLTPWTQRCLRQADLVLTVGHAGDDPEPGVVERALMDPPTGVADATPPRYELVILHESDEKRPTGTIRWLNARARGGLAAHHHVRLDRANDVARLARSIAGASLGLALSGGGARGFAQIGVMRALDEHGLAIDLVGGTSMGSVMGGLHAMGFDLPTMIAMSRKGFMDCEVVGDLTAPIVALMRGTSTVKMLKWMFGDVQIEDLWIPYFCVTTNLSRAEVVIHDRGPLWLWTRASSSVPGIGPPVPYHGDLLVDGGVLNNLPVDIMRQRCRGATIAVDVSAPVELRTGIDLTAEMSGWPHLARALNPMSRREPFPNIVRILSRTATLSSVHNQELMREMADLYLHPPTDDVDLLNWSGVAEIADIGYRYSHGLIGEWMQSDSRATGTHAVLKRTGSWTGSWSV
jgi:lysophospholipid hydrolase